MSNNKEIFLAQYGSAKHIDELVKNKTTHPNTLYHIAGNSDIQPHHIDHIIEYAPGLAYRIHDLKSHQIDKLLHTQEKNPTWIGLSTGLSSTNRDQLEPKHIDRLLKFADVKTNFNLLHAKNLQPHHIDHLLDFNNRQIDERLSEQNSNIQPHHIDKLIDRGNDIVNLNLAYHPNIQKHQLKRLSENENSSRYLRNLASDKLKKKHG